MWAWTKENWERCFLFLIAMVFLAFSVQSFLDSEVTGAISAFVMFFLCLIYSNVARFKRFKGLGFEAELWEDKQKEAADLIERMKNIVQVYTREIVLAKVMSGRWGGGANWPERWALYEELVGQHDTLGQKINFLPLKEKVYRVMVSDAVGGISTKLSVVLNDAYARAHKAEATKFGSPIEDARGYQMRLDRLDALKYEMRGLYKLSETENVAKIVLNNTDRIVQGLRDEFDLEVELPKDEIEKLQKIDELYQVGDFRADPELMRWADRS